MEIIRRLEELRPGPPSVVTVGVFDGVHLGHQTIMQMVRAAASSLGARSVVVTFDRPPEEYVHPQVAAPYITTLEQKLALIAAQGMDLAVVLPLEEELMSMSPEQFVTDVLVDRLSVAEVVVGTNFAFGRGRAGSVKMLHHMGEEIGFKVMAVSPIRIGEIAVSSTAIRGLIGAGEIDRANELLGHPFMLQGKVVGGEGIGRSLGFPTANVQAADKQIVPAYGVYAVTMDLDGKTWPGACSIGTRPTTGERAAGVEVYIIGYSGNIYGRDVEVAFKHKIRNEIEFSNVEALKRQIQHDVDQVLRLLG